MTRGQLQSLGNGRRFKPQEDKPTALDRWLVQKLAGYLRGAPLAFVLWDDSQYLSGGGDCAGRICIHDRRALFRIALFPEIGFGELFSVGRVTVTGDLVGVLAEAYRHAPDAGGARYWLGRLSMALGLAQSQRRSRHNIHHHYDLGNDFYELWLDREAMQYTCAYYPEPDMTLEQAQLAKLDHVCRKLWLEPGETVVEAGSGWGGFALFMARHYGVRVRAYNISHEQVVYSRERARREGLTEQVEFIEDDYRNIRGTYDVFASVGMLEHVGPGNYRELGRVIDRCLKPDGRGLIHTIGRDRPGLLHPWIRRRIFPGACPPSLSQMTRIFEPTGLSVLDAENLRPHYAKTLAGWLQRYEENVERVASMFDDDFVRAWRLYLAGSVAAFQVGSLQLFQVLFARTGGNRVPWSRSHLYTTDDPRF